MNERRYRQAERALFEDAGIDPIERRIALPTLGVTARILEIGEGAPVVCLHGGPDAAATWSYLAAAATGARLLLVDRPGTGLSDPLLSVPDVATLPGYVSQLTIDVLDALGLQRAHLLGSSFGGYSALRTALEHPDRVTRIVLAGCPPFVPGWTAPGFFTLLRTPILGRVLLSAPVTRASVRSYLRQMGHGRSLAEGSIPVAMLEWIRSWQRDTDTMRNDAAMIVACGTRRGGFDPRLDLTPDELRQVGAPCSILVGTDDPVGGEDVAANLASLLSDATVDVWSGAGHLPWLDDPVRAGAAIMAVGPTSDSPERAL
jgi:pimeloyl-ACP methyl ester carboxylesterase